MKVCKSNWKVQRLTVELRQTIIPTRASDILNQDDDIVYSTTKSSCRKSQIKRTGLLMKGQ